MATHINGIATNDSMPDMLYHYTSISGFSGIIENNCFWATSCKCLNDSNEIYELLTHYDLTRSYSREYLTKRIQWILDDHYVISFSENKDSLPMWGRYTNDCGVNIGLLKDEIMKLHLEDDPLHEPLIGNCIYSKFEKDAFIQKYLCNSKLSDLEGQLYFWLPFFKNDSFSYEKEWRIVFSGSGVRKIKTRGYGKKKAPYITASPKERDGNFQRIKISELNLSSIISGDMNKKSRINEIISHNNQAVDRINNTTSTLIV